MLFAIFYAGIPSVQIHMSLFFISTGQAGAKSYINKLQWLKFRNRKPASALLLKITKIKIRSIKKVTHLSPLTAARGLPPVLLNMDNWKANRQVESHITLELQT